MKLDLTEERYRFDFPKAKELYKFDERDTLSPTFHGAPMKAVDVMAEFDKFQLWIEIKGYTDEDIQHLKNEKDQKKAGDNYHIKDYLVKNFKGKFRDTFLYRYCEDKIKKPIIYVCLTNFDNTLNSYFKKELMRHIPGDKANPKRWTKELIPKDKIFVVNEATWERNFQNMIGICKSY